MRTGFARRAPSVIGLALALCLGCSSGPGDAVDASDAAADGGEDGAADVGPAFVLSLTTPEGGAPERYRVVVSFGAAAQGVTCGPGATPSPSTPTPSTPSTADGALVCAPGGVSLAATPDTLTVRAPGYRIVQSVPFPAGDAPVLALEALAPFEATAAYRTGVGAADGFAAFEELAWPSSTDLGPAEVVKFYIHDLPGETEVYLQNTRSYPLHYEFARQVVGIALTPTEFLRQTYSGPDRTAIAGSLVYHPEATAASAVFGGTLTAPVLLTFFPSDDVTPEQVLLAHRLLDERLPVLGLDGGGRRLVYLPAGSSQEAAVRDAADAFARADVLWVTHRELYGDLERQLLNPGVAYGTLRRMSPEELARSVVSFQDILVLTRLPNELPVVGGTITEELQTPLAHVNVAARNRGTPNLALLSASERPDVAPLLGQLVRFEVTRDGWSLAPTTIEEARAFWEAQGGEPFVPEADVTRFGLLGFSEIGFADAITVGVKAANVAELSTLLGERAPHGFAVPFAYYDAFLDATTVTPTACAAARADCVDEGRSPRVCDEARALCEPPGGAQSLRDHIARLLAADAITADAPLREAALDGVRHVMRHAPVDETFATGLDTRVRILFGGETVRLRSSTNAEDLTGFSGAGLYESVSARADDAGDLPSDEIRKVWASVWNWRAFEERAFWGIDHEAVYMGVLVHQAFPDEAANGVLITQNIADPTVAGMYVNVQLGEVPVTNPEDGALPEVLSLLPAPGGGVQVARQRFSSLSPDAPILSDDELGALWATAGQVQLHFAPLYGVTPEALALDLEFKFHGPERALFVKQVRPYVTGGH